jgi:nucleoside-diphosphate-sugar epimerase
MNNLVIGSEGFVGRSLCTYLAGLGQTVTRFDLKRSAEEDARCTAFDFKGVERVYFLAWDVGGAKYLYRDDVQIRQFDWNVALMLNTFTQLRQATLPFLFVSSQLAQECDTAYGVTKRLGETWTKLLGGVRVRLWNVYGPLEEVSERSHVVADFVWQAVRTNEIKMLTDGEEQRQFIHVDDVCSAFHVALDRHATGIYDIASFEWCKVIDVAHLVADLTGARVVPGTRRGSTPITPMVGKLPDWRPTVSLEDGLRRMVVGISEKRC